MFSDPLHILLYTAAALLPVANPMGLSAPFYTMTSHMEVVARRRVAWRVAAYFFALVTGTLVLGVLVLEIFDISIGVVDIAGGLVLFHAAWKMLEDDGSGHGDHEGRDDPAFFPLTMPLTADAAVLAIAISISGSLKHHWDYHTVIEYGAAVGGIGIVALVVGICYSTSHHTVGRLGQTGIKVVTAITAFLLLAVAVEIIVTGVKDVAAHFDEEPALFGGFGEETAEAGEAADEEAADADGGPGSAGAGAGLGGAPVEAGAEHSGSAPEDMARGDPPG